jgi:hypothetical protein
VKYLAVATVLLSLFPRGLLATDPPAVTAVGCAVPNNRIVGPRTHGRPLPLLTGDAAEGFRPACLMAWNVIDPTNQPMIITACLSGGLLQIDVAARCGVAKGKLWISSRWVITSAELASPGPKSAACQQMQTDAYAASRAIPAPCVTGNPAIK